MSEGIGAWWPTPSAAARFVSAVDYLRAQRARTLLMQRDGEGVGEGRLLRRRQRPAHHEPDRPPDGLPAERLLEGAARRPALTFTGRLYGETDLLTVAKAYQDATGHHLKRPPEETWVSSKVEKKEK